MVLLFLLSINVNPVNLFFSTSYIFKMSMSCASMQRKINLLKSDDYALTNMRNFHSLFFNVKNYLFFFRNDHYFDY